MHNLNFLNETLSTAPLWAVAVVFVVAYVVAKTLLTIPTGIVKGVKWSVAFIKWVFKPAKPKTAPEKPAPVSPVPAGYKETGNFILGSNGEHFPEYAKV